MSIIGLIIYDTFILLFYNCQNVRKIWILIELKAHFYFCWLFNIYILNIYFTKNKKNTSNSIEF